jgi:hypothetical protein
MVPHDVVKRWKKWARQHRKEAGRAAEEAEVARQTQEIDAQFAYVYKLKENAAAWHTISAEYWERSIEVVLLAKEAGLEIEPGLNFILYERVTVSGEVKLKRIKKGDQNQFSADQVIEICNARIKS